MLHTSRGELILSNNLSIIAAFILYLLLMMAIGIFYYRRTKNMSDYILGDRKLGAWVTSMSAEASDMSGWMLMGLPGYAYVAGLNAGWIALGLALGTFANWKFVAIRLRKYTELANNSLTLPDFLQNRYQDSTNLLRIIPAIFILIFFIIYTSSGFVAGGKLFETIFGLPYTYALFLGAFVVVFYTFVGGFLAVCWTDFIQGLDPRRFFRNGAGHLHDQSRLFQSVHETGRLHDLVHRIHFPHGLGPWLFRPAAYPRALHGNPFLR